MKGGTSGTAAPSVSVLMVAPVWLRVPPPGYGGIEWIVHYLAEGLRGRGHEVVLVASGDSGSAVSTRSAYEVAPTDLMGTGTTIPEVHHALEAQQAFADFRPHVVHDHTFLGPLCYPGGTPVVVTAHGPTHGELGGYYQAISPRVELVAISESQRAALPGARWARVVHNAIEVSTFPSREEKDDFLLFLGRMSPEKGAHLAAEAAARCGVRLLLAGNMREPDQRDYFDQKVRPLLGPLVTYVGEAGAEAKRELLARARAVLFPICWDEPFGLVMAEALACGTPVVAFRRGSVPEIVDDGATGFVVDDVEGMVRAIGRVEGIEPARCREAAETRFDVSRMVAEYEDLFLDLAGGAARPPALTPARSAS